MKFKLFTLFILIGLILSSCGGNVAATQPAAAGGGGGTVPLVIPEEPAGLNRYLADAAIVYQVSDATVIGLTTLPSTRDSSAHTRWGRSIRFIVEQ